MKTTVAVERDMVVVLGTAVRNSGVSTAIGAVTQAEIASGAQVGVATEIIV